MYQVSGKWYQVQCLLEAERYSAMLFQPTSEAGLAFGYLGKPH